MSGCCWEYVMGNYNNNMASSGIINWSLIGDEYKDIYTGTDGGYNGSIKGDAVYEVSNGAWHNGSSWVGETRGWDGDYSYMPNSSGPFFVRGGYYNVTSDAGVCAFGNPDGGPFTYRSFRPVVISVP